jgi:oxygen-dependent protoporphyrinogen oxidase
VLSEPFRKRPTSEIRDESVDSLVRRRLGSKVADNLVSGMIHGIYAADSRQLSVRSGMGVLWDAEDKWGTILGGMILGTKGSEQKAAEAAEWAELGELGKEREKWSLYGMRGGLSTFSQTLQDQVIKSRVDVRLNEGVDRIEPTSEGSTRITTSKGTTSTDLVISALSPYHLSKILPSGATLPHLTHNPSTSVGVVSLVFPGAPTSIHPDGFGYLIPRSGAHYNPEGILGVVFDSTAVPGLDGSLEGKITKLTVMMGGPYWSSPSYSTSPRSRPTDSSELLQPALDHLHRVFPPLANVKPLLAIPRLHLDSIPTYLPHHGQRLRAIHEAMESGPWKGKLSLVGNGYGGVGVNDCIYSAEEVVAGIKAGGDPTGLERWAEWK